MSRSVVFAIVFVLLTAIFAISSKFIHLKPEGRIAEAATVASSSMISPFDIMIKHGKNLRVEEWGDAF
jgi:hypothetical protein